MIYIIPSILLILFLLKYQLWRLPVSWSYPRILMYHSVENSTPDGMNITPDVFEKQIIYLKKKRLKFVTISNLITSRDTRKKVALTFDDGFENNYTEMFPILRKHNVCATIYLAPNIKDIKKLNSVQIKEMQESGIIEFGAHTMTHVNLKNSDKETARQEIIESKNVVEKLTGAKCQSFAYPFGRYDQKDVQLVKDAGFNSALTTKKQINLFNKQKPFNIPRLSVNGKMDMLQFYVMLSRGRYRF